MKSDSCYSEFGLRGGTELPFGPLECAIGIAKIEGFFAHAKSLDLRRQQALKLLERGGDA